MQKNIGKNLLISLTHLSVILFFTSNYCVLGAQKICSPFRQILSTTCIIPKLNNSIVEQRRTQSSTFKDAKKKHKAFPERSSLQILPTNEHYEDNTFKRLFQEYSLLLKEKKDIDDIGLKSKQRKNVFSQSNEKLSSSPADFLSNTSLLSVKKLESGLCEQSGEIILDGSGSKSKVLRIERVRFNRLFTLLPEYHPNSITRIMLGKTAPKKNIPVWKDLLNAIDQINQEALREGDEQKIDLNYFRNIYSLVKNTPGKTSHVLSDDILQTRDGVYSMTKKEHKILNRLFTLLPEYHPNSMTRILLGKTAPKKNIPVWKDLLNAIDQINQEALREGDEQKIDLNYFRKLQWLSIRITGKGGSR